MDNNSTFDPVAFQSAQFTEANSTDYVLIPPGDYIGAVDKFNIRTTPKGQVILDVTWSIDDADVAAETGMEHPTARQSIFLDINDNGSLETSRGKNVGLGRLREALGQNVSGQPWSFGMIVGQVARIVIKHRIDGENTYVDVTSVGKV